MDEAQPQINRRQFIGAVAATASANLIASKASGEISTGGGAAVGRAFHSGFHTAPDRVWIGPQYWANPMEDWRIAGGRLECTSRHPNRSVHLLTHDLAPVAAAFEVSVRLGMTETGEAGNAGFRFAVRDDINDYRSNCTQGRGPVAVVHADRTLELAHATAKLPADADLSDLTLKLAVSPAGASQHAVLTAVDKAGRTLGSVSADLAIAPDQFNGNVALVCNASAAHSPYRGGDHTDFKGSRCGFADWTLSGAKVAYHPERAFGPILFSLYTLSNNRSADGYVMKMTAQLPPMGKTDPKQVTLEVQRGGEWVELAKEGIDRDACTATFRITKWDPTRDTPYRLSYAGQYYEGIVCKEPLDHPLVIGNLTCQLDHGFPYGPLVKNLGVTKPDLLYFSGDQVYQPNGGFGIITSPADRSILNYLRKWYMFGWAFGDLMRDRPTVCLPDDHDVYHGNLWGEAGKPMTPSHKGTSSYGGYAEPARMVNVVHRTNCAHNPDLYDPTPVAQGISVYYGDMVYARISFGIVGDREFKSGPDSNGIRTDGPRGDWVVGPNFDVSTLDKPGLAFLGERQMKFLEHWVGDWRGADMKVLLSATVFANPATHHGQYDHRLQADLDSGGWPQTPVRRAVRLIRKAYPLHMNGDQHLTTLLQYGADDARDACWSFCAPAICSIYERWWRADELHFPYTDRPAHNLPNTGQYRDGFGHPIYLYAVGNPTGTGEGKTNRYDWTEDRGGGFGVVRIDRKQRTYACESYRFRADLTQPKPGDQYPGFPHTIAQRENYGRKIVGHLPRVRTDLAAEPVLKVVKQETGELVYAIRLTENSVEPWVFEPGTYTVQLGDPDADKWTTFTDQKSA